MLLMGVLVVGFFVAEAAGYAVHRFLHSPWAGPLHRAHHAHHFRLYPPGDFLSAAYRNAGGEDTVLLFLPFALPVVVALLLLAPLAWALVLIVDVAMVALLNNYIHTALHIEGHWTERIPGFERLRWRHMIHHDQVELNFGIFSFVFDRLFGTLLG